MDSRSWKDNNTLHFVEADGKCWIQSIDNLCPTILNESSAKSWTELRLEYSSCQNIVIEHLLKLFYFRNFDIYKRGWIETCSKYFRTVPIIKATHKPPRKEQLYNVLWKDMEDTFDSTHSVIIKDLNNYEDLPNIKHPDSESAHDFCQEYMMWVSIRISEKEPLDTVSTYNTIINLLKKYPLK